MWTSTNGESIWLMARWRWLFSTASSKKRSSSRSKARLTAPLWSKPKTIRPEKRKQSFLLHTWAHRRPERNPTPGSVSTAKLVPFFAASDMIGQNRLNPLEELPDDPGKDTASRQL